MSRRKEDNKVADRLLAVNRQHFSEALRLCGGDILMRRARGELGIPEDGFADKQAMAEFLCPISPRFEQEEILRSRINEAARKILAALRLTENYETAVRHYFLTGEIGHIPGNFAIVVKTGRPGLEVTEYAPMRTEERRAAERIKKFIYRQRQVRPRRVRKNANRDNEVLKLSRMKGRVTYTNPDTGRDTALVVNDLDIVGQTFNDEDISRQADKRRVKVIKQARWRAKKRH